MTGAAIGLLAGLLLGLSGLSAHAADEDLSDETRACLKCHDKPHIATRLADGSTLSLSISTEGFLASMHAEQDCTDCHAELDDDTHGKLPSGLASRRELTQAMQDTCRDCHKKKYKDYDDSLHATLVQAGNDEAPLCADCHNAHTQASVKDTAPIDKTPCASCHDKIFQAYTKDVHGLAREKHGEQRGNSEDESQDPRKDGRAPICADCHQSHAVQAASLGDGPKEACLSCHEATLQSHRVWLPNTQAHFDAISCPACHAPTAERRVNLRLYDAATGSQLREKVGVPQFAQRAQAGDVQRLGLDEHALWSLLAQFNADDGPAGAVVVRGRLEVRDGVQAHQMAEKSRALKDCDTCHRAGAEPFQSVVLSIASADGRPLRHDVRSDVLSSLTALESVRGFYAIGSTRIVLLDWLLALALAGSIAGCLAHMGVRRLFKGMRERLAAEAAAQAASGSSPDASPPTVAQDDRGNA